jgi:Cu-Zn family superoxide dismutase
MRARPMLGVLLSLGLALPAAAQQPMPQARGTFINPQGQQIGTATLVQTPAGVLITLHLRGLPPGPRAFHIHEIGRCDADGAFESAGDHFNPGGHQHGFHAEGGAHAGDMPNQVVGADGVLRAEVLNDKVTLGPGEATLFDADGASLVIHAEADDHRSQPAGDAGGRIACAVIERQG